MPKQREVKMIDRTVYRKGESTEAIVYQHLRHPHIEIAAQRCEGQAWNIFYISPQKLFTIKTFRGDNQIVRSVADIIARALANECLHRDNPSKYARNVLRS